jgi:hypothetical protein
MLLKHFDILVSNNPAIGAQRVSDDGATFTIRVDGGLGVPDTAKNVNVSVINADLWNNSPNVVEGKNTIEFKTNSVDPWKSVDIPPGLYDGSSIGDAILDALRGHPELPDDLGITIEPVEASGVMKITFTIVENSIGFFAYSILRFKFNEVGVLLGFPNEITAAPVLTSQTEPRFNTLNYWLIQSDIVPQGIPVNGQYDAILAKITSDVESNFQVLYEPINPGMVPAQHLAGSAKSTYIFSLINDSFRPVNTRGEFWAAQLRISYAVFE